MVENWSNGQSLVAENKKPTNTSDNEKSMGANIMSCKACIKIPTINGHSFH